MTENLGFSTKNLNLWAVEVGKGNRAYRTRYTFASDKPVMAQRWYDGLLVHSGYKKRLVNPNGIVVQRTIT